ncbi:NusB antitermination factor [Trema orientale]|uniref:NusB antitermination factor n=1 Tax=Trema orientale TaxID=63057 RepID=A0A2P5FCV2_TREOI|nr:NusB antitermination factor [Trema orientale]
MEGSSLLTTSSSLPSFRTRTHFSFSFSFSLSPPQSSSSFSVIPISVHSLSLSCPRSSLRTSTFTVDQAPQIPTNHSGDPLPKTDKSGRFCSPRAARELALSIIYAACLEGSDPIRLFEKRINARREPGYEFDKASLLQYNHMSFGGPPVTVETVEEEDELKQIDDKESAIEAEVLAAPPKMVYSKLILRLTRKFLVAVVDQWDSHVIVIDKVVPPNWKDEPAGKILELCILHLAMSEISVLRTRHQIVINEAVDLAKRFCDGAAPRIINGCLRTFVRNIEDSGLPLALEDKQKEGS